MTPQEYAAYQEAIGRGVVALCPWCFDWEDIEDAMFDRAGNFWCCFGCSWPGSPRHPSDAISGYELLAGLT